MKQRVQTSLILLLIFIPVLFFNDYFLLMILPFLSYFAMSEVLNATKLKIGKFMHIFVLFAPLLYVVSHFYPVITEIHVLLVSLFIFIVQYIFKQKMQISTTTFLFFMVTFIGFALLGAVQIRGFGRATLLYLVIATFFTDIGAYIVGVKFGKTKLIEYVSPNKTIAGSVGGIIFSMLSSITFAIVMEIPLSIVFIVLCSIILSITAQIGDLFFSALKREVKIKDFSNFLPGHGGVLDRFDSLFTNIVVFSLLLSFATFL